MDGRGFRQCEEQDWSRPNTVRMCLIFQRVTPLFGFAGEREGLIEGQSGGLMIHTTRVGRLLFALAFALALSGGSASAQGRDGVPALPAPSEPVVL